MKTTKACYSQTLFLLYVNVFTLLKIIKKKIEKGKKKGLQALFKTNKQTNNKTTKKLKNEHTFILHICRTDNSNFSVGDILSIRGQQHVNIRGLQDTSDTTNSGMCYQLKGKYSLIVKICQHILVPLC